MKIVLVSRFYSMRQGGIAVYVAYLFDELIKRGHDVKIITQQPASAVKNEEKYRDHIIYLPPHKKSLWFLFRISFLKKYEKFVHNLYYAYKVRKSLLKLAKTFKPDIVEYADIEGEGVFHPKSVCPYVVKLHIGHDFLHKEGTKIPYFWKGIAALERKMIYRADGVCAPSQWLADEAGSIYRFSAGKVHYVTNPINTEIFHPVSEIPNDRKKEILCVARLEKRKGVICLAEAVKTVVDSIPEAHFVFLGTDRNSDVGGSQEAELRDLFKKQGVGESVSFQTYSSREHLLRAYAMAAVVAVPAKLENCPYSVLEAMSCGKATIVSNSTGMKEMILHGNTGMFFQPNNSRHLAEVIIGLLRDPAQCKKLGDNARSRILEVYEAGKVAQETLTFYKEILKN